MLTSRWRIALSRMCVVGALVPRVDRYVGGVVRAPGSSGLVAAGVVKAGSPHLTKGRVQSSDTELVYLFRPQPTQPLRDFAESFN